MVRVRRHKDAQIPFPKQSAVRHWGELPSIGFVIDPSFETACALRQGAVIKFDEQLKIRPTVCDS
jgi:hypothetical protein